MKRPEDGGYDIWGVLYPNGKIREFSTEDRARVFIDKMEGQTLVDNRGVFNTVTGLTLVHRFIPTWTPIPLDPEEQP